MSTEQSYTHDAAYREALAMRLYLEQRVGERSWWQLDGPTRDDFRQAADEDARRASAQLARSCS